MKNSNQTWVIAVPKGHMNQAEKIRIYFIIATIYIYVITTILL